MSTVALILSNLDLIAGVATALLGADALHALPKSVRWGIQIAQRLFAKTPADAVTKSQLDATPVMTDAQLGTLTDEERALVMHSRGQA